MTAAPQHERETFHTPIVVVRYLTAPDTHEQKLLLFRSFGLNDNSFQDLGLRIARFPALESDGTLNGTDGSESGSRPRPRE
jgi:hypothetical protein